MSRADQLTRTVAVAVTAAFAGGALLTQTVIVPLWRSLPTFTFLQTFTRSGPLTGATIFPFELASAVLLAVVWRRWRGPGRLPWALATVGMIGTLALLGYFVPTNLALLDPAFPSRDVPGTLAAWYGWDWARTGLGIASAVLACVGHGRRPVDTITVCPT